MVTWFSDDPTKGFFSLNKQEKSCLLLKNILFNTEKKTIQVCSAEVFLAVEFKELRKKILENILLHPYSYIALLKKKRKKITETSYHFYI